jgi:hypothetical protein
MLKIKVWPLVAGSWQPGLRLSHNNVI